MVSALPKIIIIIIYYYYVLLLYYCRDSLVSGTVKHQGFAQG